MFFASEGGATAVCDGSPSVREGLGVRRKRRRRRRWFLIPVVLILLLAVLASLLPAILSTALVARFVTGEVNKRILGTADIASLSLSWRGPCSLEGLQLQDPEGRQVLSADSVRCSIGLWDAVQSWQDFGEILVESPEVVLYQDEDGSVSLSKAMGMRGPEPPEPGPAPLPRPRGTVKVSKATVRVVRPNQTGIEASSINATLDLETLNSLQGNVALDVVGVGAVCGEFQAKGLFSSGGFGLTGATVTLSLRTPEGLALEPLAAFADGPALLGTLNLETDLAMEKGKPTGLVLATVTDFAAPYGAAPARTPARVDAAFALQLRKLGGLGESGSGLSDGLKENAVWALLDVRYDPEESFAAPAFNELLSAPVAGEAVELPPLEAELEGRADVARVVSSIPGLLRLRSGVEVTGGHVDLRRVHAVGGKRPGLTVDVGLTGVTLLREGEEIGVEPVSLLLDCVLDPGVGLTFNEGRLVSDFANAHIAGTSGNLNGGFQADLAKLRRQLAEFLDLEWLALQGEADAEFTLLRETDGRVNAHLSLSTQSFGYRGAGPAVSFERAALTVPLTIIVQGTEVQSLKLPAGTVTLDETISANFGFDYDLTTEAWSGYVQTDSTELRDVVNLAELMGVSVGHDLTGLLQLRIDASRPASGTPVNASASATVESLAYHGKPLGVEQVGLRIADLTYEPARKRASVGAVTVTAPAVVELSADVESSWGEGLSVQGHGKVDADLRRIRSLGAVLADGSELPEFTGRLTYMMSAALEGHRVMLSGHGDVTNLEIAAGESTISEPVVRLEHELAMDRGSDLLRVDHLGVTSTTLTAEVNGTVKELSSRRLLDLRGTYQADWDHLTPLLHELAPSSADVFALSGTTGSEFHLTGPLHEPVAVPGYRELEAGAAVGWSAGDVLGIELGKADVPLVLEAARVDVPVTQITASGGMLRLGGTVDLQGSEPVYRLLGRTMVLENVQVDREVGQRFLSRVNPIFADLAHLEGTLSLALEDVELPLGEGLATSGQGRGRLALSNLKLEPTGLLQTIMALEGVPASAVQSAKVSDLNFVIRDGRILYDDLLITLTEKLDLLFHGSVGLDGTQELWVSVPVRAALLQKLGAKGPLEEYAQLLAEENARVDIPILGERLHSSLGMANIGPLMEKAAGAYVKKLARQGLEGRLKGEEERTPAEEGATPEPGGAPTESIPKEVPAPPGSEEKEPADEDLRQRGRGLLRQLIPREETQAGEEGN